MGKFDAFSLKFLIDFRKVGSCRIWNYVPLSIGINWVLECWEIMLVLFGSGSSMLQSSLISMLSPVWIYIYLFSAYS